MAINYTNPWVIDEIYNAATTGNVKGLLATFGTSIDALTGKFKPTGKRLFTTPVSEDTVKNQNEDVPGYSEWKSCGLFQFNEGPT